MPVVLDSGNYPPEAERLPSVGGFVDVSLEAVLALRPDLVIGARGPAGPSLAERLGARGIETYFPPTESVIEIEKMILGLAGKVGRALDGERLVAAQRVERREIQQQVAGQSAIRTLLLVGAAPIVAAGRGSFLDEMLTLTGGKNVLENNNATTSYPSLALEQVLVLDPDVILLVMSEDMASLDGSEVWQRVRAVREKKTIRLAPDVLQRPGPRLNDGLRELLRALHPELVAPTPAPASSR
ncbi:MAG: helical backbone metal receptor [Polyangiaceae bacterium]